jgi:hypothetical protein
LLDLHIYRSGKFKFKTASELVSSKIENQITPFFFSLGLHAQAFLGRPTRLPACVREKEKKHVLTKGTRLSKLNQTEAVSGSSSSSRQRELTAVVQGNRAATESGVGEEELDDVEQKTVWRIISATLD